MFLTGWFFLLFQLILNDLKFDLLFGDILESGSVEEFSVSPGVSSAMGARSKDLFATLLDSDLFFRF